MRKTAAIVTMTLALACASAALAADDKDQQAGRPPAIEALFGCRQVADASARLACFDRALATIETEERENRVIFADGERMRKTRRGLFGLGGIDLGVFGKAAEFDEIDAGVRRVTVGRDGKMQFVLDDGATWVQTDTVFPSRKVLKATTVHIKRTRLGGFVAEFDGVPIRVRRIS